MRGRDVMQDAAHIFVGNTPAGAGKSGIYCDIPYTIYYILYKLSNSIRDIRFTYQLKTGDHGNVLAFPVANHVKTNVAMLHAKVVVLVDVLVYVIPQIVQVHVIILNVQ